MKYIIGSNQNIKLENKSTEMVLVARFSRWTSTVRQQGHTLLVLLLLLVLVVVLVDDDDASINSVSGWVGLSWRNPQV